MTSIKPTCSICWYIKISCSSELTDDTPQIHTPSYTNNKFITVNDNSAKAALLRVYHPRCVTYKIKVKRAVKGTLLSSLFISVSRQT